MLAMIAALQAMGYSVDILARARSMRLSTLQLVDEADDHGFSIKPASLSYVAVNIVGTRLYTHRHYDLFVSLGDDRAPPYHGIGDINVHLCTFPYLPENDMESAHLFTLSSYDVVITPSTYAHSNYLFFTELYLVSTVRDGGLIPQLFPLPPPHFAGDMLPSPPDARFNIVVPGHFAYNYKDVHQSALALFQSMQDRLPPQSRLILYGSTGHGNYVAWLKRLVRSAPVDVVTDPTASHQKEMLASARVVWFLRQEEDETLEWRKPEPRVEWRLYQFMGASLASAMRMGTLPIVTDGDVHDLVVDTVNGFVASGLGGVATATLAAFKDDVWKRMTQAAVASMAPRNFQTYTTDLDRIIRHAQSAQTLRRTLKRVGSALKAAPVTRVSSKTAVCVELRHHYALRSSAINVMSRLPSWSLTVFHGLTNSRFAYSVLLDMPDVNIQQLPYKSLTAAQYSDLIASPAFWARINADTVFLFSAGTVLTGSVDDLLAVPGVVAASERPEETVDLGRPGVDGGVHAACLVDVKKAQSTTGGGGGARAAAPAACSVSADGVCYGRATRSAVAITATARFDDDARLKSMLGAAFGVPEDVSDALPDGRANARQDPLLWTIYAPSARAPLTAALYTPFDIIYGGGESYLLQSAASLQSFGYAVDIIVHPENLAKTVDDVMRTAQGLRVGLQRRNLRILHVPHAGDTLAMAPLSYSVFLSMGNEKAPKLRGIGLVNFYVCQFPFDLSRPPISTRTRTLATYDYVLVYSHYVYTHYAKFASTLFESMVDADLLIPHVELLPPAVQPFEAVQAASAPRKHIALLGRIFLARQGKGQHVAIAAFKALQGRIPGDVRLLLIGNVVPGHEAYLDQLRRKAAGLNVDIITGQSQERVLQLMQSSLVQWHMTGADLIVPDPASYEHFGMAIVEGMSLGCLPVVLKHGGGVDIVRDGVNGYLAADVDEIVDKTAAAYALPATELRKMTEAGRSQADVFSPSQFSRKFEIMLRRGLLTRPLKHAIRQGAPAMRARTPLAVSRSTTNLAVLVEPRQHYALRFCTLNVMTHLPRSVWGLHVFHGTTNGRFVRSVLADVDGVRYTRVPVGVMTIPLYNDLLKSASFWTAMRADNVLLFQTDSLLLGTNIGDFVGRYDYVGAPWHQENDQWSTMRDTLGPQGVGNGGLSLRTTASALDIIRRHGAATNDTENEDVFFVKHALTDGHRLAQRQTAYGFCLEVPCAELDPVGEPLAVHAAWYYNNEDRVAALLDKAI